MRALFAGVYVSMRIVGYSSVRHPVCYAQHIAAERLNKSALLAAATTSYDTEALLFYFVDHIYQLSPAADKLVKSSYNLYVRRYKIDS